MTSPEPILLRRSRFERASADQAAALRGVPTAMIGDALGRRRGLGPSIRACTRDAVFAGPALTVRCRAGDNLAALVSLQSTLPGDVVVIACGAATDAAVLGGNYLRLAKARGAVAVVTDGPIRDADEIDALGIPVFAAGFTPNGPFKTGPGEIGLPVTVGGLVIEPGDLLVGDRDGVLAIPRARIDEAIDGARHVQAREASMARSMAAGATPDWLAALIGAVQVRDLD